MSLILLVHFKVYKNNIFLIISNGFGRVLLSISSGCIGFNNSHKNSIEAFNKILLFSVEFLSKYNKSYKIFLKFENVRKHELLKIYKIFD